MENLNPKIEILKRLSIIGIFVLITHFFPISIYPIFTVIQKIGFQIYGVDEKALKDNDEYINEIFMI